MDEDDRTMEELMAKKQHPQRLHPEMWFNDPGEVTSKIVKLSFFLPLVVASFIQYHSFLRLKLYSYVFWSLFSLLRFIKHLRLVFLL